MAPKRLVLVVVFVVLVAVVVAVVSIDDGDVGGGDDEVGLDVLLCPVSFMLLCSFVRFSCLCGTVVEEISSGVQTADMTVTHRKGRNPVIIPIHFFPFVTPRGFHP